VNHILTPVSLDNRHPVLFQALGYGKEDLLGGVEHLLLRDFDLLLLVLGGLVQHITIVLLLILIVFIVFTAQLLLVKFICLNC